MIFVMALMLIAPAAAMAIIIIVAMAVGDSITRCWIPWCCGVFCGAVTAFFFWQTVNALLVASNAAFVCIAIDKENGVGEVSTSAEGGALYALVQGEIAEEVKALKEGGEGARVRAVAVTLRPRPGRSEMTAVPPLMPPPPPTGRRAQPRRPATGPLRGAAAAYPPRSENTVPSNTPNVAASASWLQVCAHMVSHPARVRTRRIGAEGCHVERA